MSAVAVAALLLAPGRASAQLTHPLYLCADRVANALRGFTQDASRLLADCETDRLITGSPADCSVDTDLAKAIDDGPVKDLGRTVNHDECDTRNNPADQSQTRFRALCPVESRDTTKFSSNVGGTVEGSTRSQLAAIVSDLFTREYPGCPRPTSQISGEVRDCANKLNDLLSERAKDLYQCYRSCERGSLNFDEGCVNITDGEPTEATLVSCLAGKAQDVVDLTVSRCDDESVLALGCPFGASDAETLGALFAERLLSYARDLSYATFHADCRTSLPGSVPELVPAEVTLEPSLTKKQVSCGQVLDSDFFGSDKVLKFDTNLDCGPLTEPLDGIIVDKNGVTIDGRGEREIIGPTSRSLRHGAGIVVAQGRKKVRITGFRRIRNFGVGILAQGQNRQLKVDRVTLFRNLQAGLRTGSPKGRFSQVVADRCGIGFDIAANNTVLQRCETRGSEPQSTSAAEPLSPGYGFHFTGSDGDLNGVATRCSQCTSLNDKVAGFVLAGDTQIVESSSVRGSLGDGVVIAGTASRFRNNSIKTSAGNGVVVTGTGNFVNKNQSDENLGAGFVVSGTGNTLNGNGAGSLTDKGNQGVGFLVTGAGNSFDTNEAEANRGGGFSIQAPTALFKGNRAESNQQVGFDVVTDGSALESNVAEKNAGFEWVVAPNNVDESGNRANGSTIAIPPGGGTFE